MEQHSQQVYTGTPVTQLLFHPTRPLLAIASGSHRSVHVLHFGPQDEDFRFCTLADAPPPTAVPTAVSTVDAAGASPQGVVSLMWRGDCDLVFATADGLLSCVTVDESGTARGESPTELQWVLSTATPLHGMCPHPRYCLLLTYCCYCDYCRCTYCCAYCVTTAVLLP
jgi:hypothetical protein